MAEKETEKGVETEIERGTRKELELKNRKFGIQEHLFLNTGIWKNLLPSQVRGNTSKMKEAFNSLDKAFKHQAAELLDYKDSILRYAYFYRYFTSITTSVRDCWDELKIEIARPLFDDFLKRRKTRTLYVCTLGGGPACEIFGLRQWLWAENIQAEIKTVILDYCDWSKETNSLLTTLDHPFAYTLSTVEFVKFDFFEDPMPASINLNHIAGADIIITVKFLSAVTTNPEKSEEILVSLLRNAKKNTLIQFVDKHEGGYLEIMEKVAVRLGFSCLLKIKNLRVILPEHELQSMEKYGYPKPIVPKKLSHVSVAVWETALLF